uniref:Uncharacterized protein n=1 Tax=Knipowitschia caucasica TaxID=637954 RepID=A0AAV2MTN2_KNICA
MKPGASAGGWGDDARGRDMDMGQISCARTIPRYQAPPVSLLLLHNLTLSQPEAWGEKPQQLQACRSSRTAEVWDTSAHVEVHTLSAQEEVTPTY